jgi:hypothetical protein
LPYLKGHCHEIFCFRFFSQIIFFQAPENNLRILSNFSDLKSRCTTGINNTGVKFAAGVNYTGGKLANGVNDTGGILPL